MVFKKIAFAILLVNSFSVFYSQANNNCASATNLTPNASCTSGTLSGSNTQTGEVTAASSHCGTANFNQSVWYSFTATSANMWVELGNISLSGGGNGYFPGRLATIVYNSTACLPAAGSIIGCDNHTDNLSVIPLTGLTVGNTYLVQVGYNDGNGSQQVSFCINVSSNPPYYCFNPQPFCSNSGITFPASINTSAPQGPAYGCLLSRPNPAWFYLEIDQPGNLSISLTSSPSVDIDFIIWGPFSSLQEGCSYGGITNAANIEDCSFSVATSEMVDIIGAQTGEVYILMVTNFSNNPTNISANQTGGTGSTDCDILFPCTMTSSNSGPVCAGGMFNLSTTEVDGATYTWSGPSFTSGVQNPSNITAPTTAGTYTYIVTADDGSVTCQSTTTLVVNANPVMTSAASSTVCSGATVNLGLTSNPLGSTFSWQATDNTNVSGESTTAQTTATISDVLTNTSGSAQNVVYTVIPTLSGCVGASQTVTVTVNPIITPTFNAVGPYCSGASIPALPTTSTNGVVGTWSPAINNTATTLYTFTPNAGQCANTTTLTITINPNITPTFDPVGPFCSGATIPSLPTTSTNGVTGTWSPAINNTSTTTYNFSPTAGQCATSTTLTITIQPNITPTFNTVGPYCSGATIPALPTTSTNGITGTWSPAINNTATTLYTFTPTAGQCATSTTLTITINDNVVPTFSFGTSGTVCSGDAVPTLPLISSNGVSGTWSPSSVSNTAGGTYTFTPNAGQCATTATYNQTVNSLPLLATVPTITPSDCGLTNGAITGAVVTGNGSLSYSWTNNTNFVVGTAIDLLNIPAGTYNLTVIDNNGCDAVFGPYSVVNPGSPDPPTISASALGVCQGESFTLTATSPVSNPVFNWTGPISSGSGSSFIIFNASLADDGLYSVTVTENNCTSGAATIDIDVFANPTADAGNDVTVTCSNPTPVITASGGVLYEWTTPNGTVMGATIILSSASTPGTYEVLVTDVNGCVDTDEVTVAIDVNEPEAIVSAPGELNCLNASIQVDGSGSLNHMGTSSGLSYSWVASAGGNIVSGGSTAISTVNTAGTYTLTVYMANGCSSSQAVNVISDISQPVINLVYDNLLTCSVTEIELDASSTLGSGLSFDWVASNGGVIDGADNLSIAEISTPGTYTLTVTGDNDCSSTTSVTINQDIEVPIATIATPQIITCIDPIIILNGAASSGGAEFVYQWTTANGNMLGVTNDNTVDVDAQGDYTLVVTNTVNECVNTATVTVTEDASIPVANAGQDVTLTCVPNTVTLDGTGSTGVGISYSWSGPGIVNGANTANPEVNQSGTYVLTIASTNGCIATDEVVVIPDANLPLADAGPNATLNCITTTIVLDGSSSEVGGSIVYQWVTVNGNIVSGGSTYQSTVNQAGTYTLIVTNTDNGCVASDNVLVFDDSVAPEADAGDNQELTCVDTEVTLSGIGSAGAGMTYNWTTSNGNIVGATNTVTVIANQPGIYTLTVTGANGCTHSADIEVTQNADVPNVVIASPLTLNCNASSVTLDGSGSVGVDVTYQWTTTDGNLISGETTNTAVVSAAGTYVLTVTSDNGCSSSASVLVQAIPNPVAGFTATPSTGFAPLIVELVNTSMGSNLTYVWQSGIGANSVDEDTEFTYTSLGSYIVSLTVTDDQGCVDVATDTITVEGESFLIVPNVFTPNGDNVNDVFVMNALYISSFKGAIFNRWGRLMYEWDDVTGGWNGLAPNGAQASEGTYYYVVSGEGEDGKRYELQGHFMLMR
jgi:gliding motility-associated-like protein